MIKHVILFSLLLFTSNSFANSASPSAIKQLDATSTKKGELTVSWLPSSDDNTAQSQLIYRVYLSEQANFVPDNRLLKTQVSGAVNAKIKDFKIGQDYFILVTATDNDGNQSYSDVLSVKIDTTNNKHTSSFLYMAGVNQIVKNAVNRNAANTVHKAGLSAMNKLASPVKK
ncbi:MAG: fibronectin type III domain-containing protein [Methylococcaceae bacterium]